VNQYQGIPYANLPDPKDPDFSFRLKNLLAIIDRWSRDTSDAFGQIKSGTLPGSNNTLLTNSAVTKDVQQAAAPTNLTQGLTDTDNIQEWYNAAGSMRAHIGPEGQLVVPLIDIYDPNIGTTNLSIDGYGGIFATNGTFGLLNVTGNTDLQGQVLLGNAAVIIDTNGVNTLLNIYDPGTGNAGIIDFQSIGVSQTYTLPAVGGTLLTQTATATLETTFTYKMNTSAGGFVDAAGSTKKMRFDLTGITAGGTRNIKWFDIAGSPVISGNTTSSSGVLGASSLTAQTGSVGSTTLLTGTAATAGVYQVMAYIKTTTAGTGGTVKATVAWNDGASQSMDIPLVTTAGVTGTVSLTTLNAFGQGSVVVYAAASQNITFTTTVAGATGSPQYAIYVRIMKL
jgi:hypothetical protein